MHPKRYRMIYIMLHVVFQHLSPFHSILQGMYRNKIYRWQEHTTSLAYFTGRSSTHIFFSFSRIFIIFSPSKKKKMKVFRIWRNENVYREAVHMFYKCEGANRIRALIMQRVCPRSDGVCEIGLKSSTMKTYLFCHSFPHDGKEKQRSYRCS